MPAKRKRRKPEPDRRSTDERIAACKRGARALAAIHGLKVVRLELAQDDEPRKETK